MVLLSRILLCCCTIFLTTSALAWESVMARNGMVVSQKRIASEIGLQVLKDGGTVVDAAVATAFAKAVLLPRAGNIGGGGFMVVRGADDEVEVYDFRETAPASAHPEMFLKDGVYDRNLHQYSGRSVGVPGTVAGLHLAWKEQGSLPWRRLVMPAVKLARQGIRVTGDMERSFKRHMKRWQLYPASKKKFTHASGRAYLIGDTFRQPVLADTLELIAEQGPAGFYRGNIAQLIADEVQRAGGQMTVEDIAAYRAKKRRPIVGSYRGYTVYSMPPPSSGGVALVEILNILEGYDLNSMGTHSADALHLMIEAMRRGFRDRAQFLGDPDFVGDMPLERLTSKSYASSLRKGIDLNKATPSQGFAKPGMNSRDTTHLSVADSDGNAVSLTYTIEEPMMVVTGAGFVLNSELGDFNAGPGLTDSTGLIGTHPNLAEPGKRPLSSMTPTIVTRNGELFLVTGSPGDRTIITTVLQTILNTVDFDMGAMAAVTAGRIFHGWFPDEVKYDQNAVPPDARSVLEHRGHKFKRMPVIGYAQVIRFDAANGILEGGADPRNPDSGVAAY